MFILTSSPIAIQTHKGPRKTSPRERIVNCVDAKTFEPIVRKWFNERFNDLTPPQAMAVPLIKNKENVLVSSPTGSGKLLLLF